ncbi:MAG: hypothetical protein WDZ93_01680 [Candidatus Paceibacterota bacterium]
MENSFAPPRWFDEDFTIIEYHTVMCPTRHYRLWGTHLNGLAFHLKIWQENAAWSVERFDQRQRGPKAYGSMSTPELRLAFDLAKKAVTHNMDTAKAFDAEYLVPRKFARSGPYLTIPGPHSAVDLLWPESANAVSIYLTPTLKDSFRHFLERP